METPWIFENIGRSTVRKVASHKDDGGDKSYRLSQWRLFCFSTDQFELDFQRPATSLVLPTVLISNGAATSLYFRSPPAQDSGL